jgi:phosphoribosyl-AMP cyclohydrolase
MARLTTGAPQRLPTIVQPFDAVQAHILTRMNQAALAETLTTGHVCYCSRARARLELKGGTLGQVQYIKMLRLGFDGDTWPIWVEPTGPACHTGQASCTYNAVRGNRLEVPSHPEAQA